MYGIAGACATIGLFASAHACARSAGSTVRLAFSIAAFTPGSSSSDQLTLLAWRISFAVERRVEHGLRVVEVLRPAVGRAHVDLGVRDLAEAREHRVARDQPELRLEAHLVELRLGDLRDRLVGLGVVGRRAAASRRPRTCPRRSPRPGSTSRRARGRPPACPSSRTPASPRCRWTPRSPAIPGGIQCWAIGPSASPPRCWRSGVAVEAGDHRLAHVEVVERRAARVHRDRAPAAAGERGELRLVALEQRLELARRRLEVARRHALAGEDAAGRDARVVVAGLELDRVQERGAEVAVVAVVGVAHEPDAAARLEAGQLAVRVALDHVRAGEDGVLLAVGRRRLAVVALRELLRHRDRDRHRERAGERGAAALGELEDDRRVVRGLDALDRLVRAGLVRRPDEVAEVGLHVAVLQVGRERALDRVLHVRRRHGAAHGRREHDPRPELDGDGLAVLGDLRDRRSARSGTGRAMSCGS